MVYGSSCCSHGLIHQEMMMKWVAEEMMGKKRKVGENWSPSAPNIFTLHPEHYICQTLGSFFLVLFFKYVHRAAVCWGCEDVSQTQETNVTETTYWASLPRIYKRETDLLNYFKDASSFLSAFTYNVDLWFPLVATGHNSTLNNYLHIKNQNTLKFIMIMGFIFPSVHCGAFS